MIGDIARPSQASSAATGQVADLRDRGIPISRPCPSWSVFGWSGTTSAGSAPASESVVPAAFSAAARVAVFMPGLGHDVGEACSAARGAGGKSRAQAMPGNLRGVDADPLGSTLDDLGDSPAGQPIGGNPAVVDPGEERGIVPTLVLDSFPIILTGRIDR